MPGIIYRVATEADLDLLVETRKIQLRTEDPDELPPDTFIDDTTRSFFAEKLEEGSFVQVIGERNGKLVATGGVFFMDFPPSFHNPSGKVAYIANMFTAPEERGTGLARTVIGMLEDEIRSRGVSLTRLVTSPLGRPVYEKCGFRPSTVWMFKEL